MLALAKPAYRRVLALVVIATLSGCATYRPLPLASQPDLVARVDDLQGFDTVRLPLDEAAVLRLVLLNNPSLVASRARIGVAQAEVLDASVLPNPSVQANLGFLVSGAGDVPAWSAGFAQSLQGLVTRRARREEARASASSTDAQLLWESWVTLSRARQLVTDLVDGEQRLALQERSAALLETRAASLRVAVARGDIDAGSASAVFAAASDARNVSNDARHALRAQRVELAGLLRLSPDAPLNLASLTPLPPFDGTAAESAIVAMGEHRPDLAALRFGYVAQEARVRGAILSQFAPLSIGVDASRDSSKVVNVGPSVALDLPLFDRQQGKIAIAEATRQQLHDEYTARIDEAAGDARALLLSIVTDAREPTPVTADTTSLDAASRAYTRGDIDAAALDDLGVATLGQATNDLTRDIYRREQRIAFDALTGAWIAGLASAADEPMSRFFLLWVSAVASCSLAGCGADADAGAAAVTPSATIQQMTPVRATFDDTVVAYGQGVAGSDGVRALSLPVDATLTATDVVAGEAVRAGQRLATFALSKPAAAARVAARSGMVLAREQRERVARLRDDHLATNEQLAQAEKALRDAQAVLAAQDTADDALRAPADGIVLGIQAQRSATITAGTPVMTFADGGKVGFVGGIEPGDMSRVHAGDIVSLHSLSGGTPQAARVTAVAAAVNPVSRLVDVTAASLLPLLQGATYRADIVVGTLEGWRLPTDAIVGEDGARAAWQVVGGKAHRVAVRVIAQHGDEALVEGAIDASLPLVTVGAAQLEEGVQVRPAVSK